MLIKVRKYYKYLKNAPISLSNFIQQKFIWKKIKIPDSQLERVYHKLKGTLKKSKKPLTLTKEDRILVDQIKTRTKEYNQNNITRTSAYYDFYIKYPEIHWTLLAHMVSRNGGWNMTDLKGDLVSDFLSDQQIKNFFLLLEKSNAHIFQDAFPQLLLYQACKVRNKNLFYLLPAFKVSDFMIPVWNEFYEKHNSQLLTIGLIINEQNNIEGRVIQNKQFQKQVFNSIPFKAQQLFQLTKVVLPYYSKKDKVKLAGVTVSDFHNLKERITIGKTLYAISFGIESVHKGVVKFANRQRHTGSRSDYWPNVFMNNPCNSDRVSKSKKVCSINTSPLIYSPFLQDAWPNQHHQFAIVDDWFTELTVLAEFSAIKTPHKYDITSEYCASLSNLMQLSILKEGGDTNEK
ncbi:DUF2515 family protein [Aquibacillus saliphilus]|uniref:DUF2515 family protein n=1 Tax=Aquibacillus saliphilus TaxID=1909422 RepID=UPI001CF098E1|nr:DUF2515 family protein [Aquibacillus saliphilus]